MRELQDLFEARFYVYMLTPHHRRGRDVRPDGLSRHTARCGAFHISPLRVNCTPKVGQVKHYPVNERVRNCTGLFPFNRDLILILL